MTLEVPVFDSYEKAHKHFVRQVLKHGRDVTSTERRWKTREIIGHSFVLSNPRNRLLFNAERDLNVYQYIGQFLWILQGNYHVDAISYYADSARRFTSDNVRNTGAYGFRLFGPGYLNQINDIVHNLEENPTSRRAVASVYMPVFDRDKTNHMDEIPCTLNLQFLVRDKKMQMVVYMRSQDVHKVMPYDIFLFTMLQEYVAARLHIRVGSYYHMSGSFHIYQKDISSAKKALDDSTGVSREMMTMPHDEPEHWFNTELNMFENELRTEVIRNQLRGKDEFALDYYFQKSSKMPEYWKQWALLLITHGCIKLQNLNYLQQTAKKIKPPFNIFITREMERLQNKIKQARRRRPSVS